MTKIAFTEWTDLTDFDPELTFRCGQTFRWEQKGPGLWHGVVRDCSVMLEQAENGVWHLSGEGPAFATIDWRKYFDLSMDYAKLQSGDLDPLTLEIVQSMRGLRILQQDKFETLLSFIISANNNVKRITSIIERLSRAYGKKLGGAVYAFPEPKDLASLTPEALGAACGAGYRSAYLIAASRMVLEGFDLEILEKMSYDEAFRRVQEIPGVGAKVADCVLLFSCGKTSAFPVDTWIRKILVQVYGLDPNPKTLHGAMDRFGQYAGYIQQRLFHYYRTHSEPFK